MSRKTEAGSGKRKGAGRLLDLLGRGPKPTEKAPAETAEGSPATADSEAAAGGGDTARYGEWDMPPPRPGATKRMPADVLPKPIEEWARVIADEAYRIERLPAGPDREKAEATVTALAAKLSLPRPKFRPAPTPEPPPELDTPSAPPKRRGRPPTGKAKTASMHLRVSEAEKAPFAKLAAEIGAPPATVLRKMLIEAGQGGVELFKEDRDALVLVSRELAAIGRNLNQLARAANRHDPVSRAEVVAVAEPLEAEVRAAREEVRRVLERGKVRRTRLTEAARGGRKGAPAAEAEGRARA